MREKGEAAPAAQGDGLVTSLAVHDPLERIRLDDAHVPLLDLDDAFLDEFRERAADGLQLEAQVAADLLAGHAQHQFGLRETPRMQALNEVEQEGREALLGAHAAQQQHHAVLAHDLAAHDLVDVVLQGRDLARQLLDALEGHDAYLGVLQCDGVAGVVVADDAVEPDDLAGHLEARHLVAPVLGGHAGLEEARADGEERREGFAVAEQRAAALDLAARGDDVIDALQLLLVQAQRHAELAQVAVRACDLDGVRIHG